ncbi:MAG: hypothetical protein IKA47_02335 [Oscillospiraceae bacterium]|nr:hypothetical protein [Oscillospiraceae bacterium]
MDWKKLGKALLFPHIAIMLILLPLATVLLVYAMVFLGTDSPVSIGAYVLSAYTLLIWCFKIPWLIRFFRKLKTDNKYLKKWREDPGLRVNVSLYGGLIWNTAYALLQLGMGFWHKSFWFCSLAAYYISLAVMRFFLVLHTSRYRPGEQMEKELKKYRSCGIVFLVMNLALSLMIFFMVYWNRTFRHHQITTIAMAAYTFTSLTLAIIGTVKFRKLGSPVYSASKAISLASACVSVLTLESTMLTTFGGETLDLTARRLFLGLSGGAISAFIIAMAVYMIARGTKQIKHLRSNYGRNI